MYPLRDVVFIDYIYNMNRLQLIEEFLVQEGSQQIKKNLERDKEVSSDMESWM